MIPRTGAYSQSSTPAEKNITEKILEDSKNSRHNYKRTESDITAAFKLLFDKYNINNIDNLLNLIGGSITKEDLLVCNEAVFQEKIKYIEQLLKENTIDKNQQNIAQKTGWNNTEEFNQEVKNKQNLDTINAIKQQYKIQNNKEANIENLSQDELKQLIKEYFEENYKQYLEKAGNDRIKAMKMLFGVMLAKTADKDKHLLLPIINEVIEDSEVLDAAINSFENEADAAGFADSISYEEWKKLPNEEIKVKYIQNMTQKGIDMQKLGYKTEVENFYKEHGEELIRIDAKLKNNPNCKLSDTERSLLDQRDALIRDGSLMTAANFGNKNLTKDEMEANAKDIAQTAQKYGFEAKYLANLAYVIKNNQFDFELSKDEIKDILDKVTNKKFTEAFDKIPEKTATDEKTGGFKTDSQANAAEAASAKVTELKATIISKTQEEDKDNSIVIEKDDSKPVLAAANTSFNTQDAIDILTGAKSGFIKAAEENKAIKKYSDMDSANQLLLLQGHIISKFFRDCIKEAKFATLRKWNELGLFAGSSSDTKFVKEMFEKRKNKLNPNALPS